MMEYHGIIISGPSFYIAGKTLAGPRIRTAAKKAGYDLLVVDYVYYITDDELLGLLDKYITAKTKIIGFSLTWIHRITRHWVHDDLIAKIRERHPHVLIITGGQDNNPKLDVDYHFFGNSEQSLIEFLHRLHGLPHEIFIQKLIGSKVKLIDGNSSNPITDINTIGTEFIKDDLLTSHEPLPLEISRGCIFSCAFCKYPHQGKASYDEYQRSPQNIAEELKRNYDLFGITRYNIMDATFNDSVEKLDRLQKAIEIAKLPKFEFCGFIRPEMLVTKPTMVQQLADIGLVGALLGIESMNNESRKAIGKGMPIEKVLDACYKLAEVNNQQVKIQGSFIAGLPYDTMDMIREWNDFFIQNQDKLFRNWRFNPLGVEVNKKENYKFVHSGIEKDPKKYGYTEMDGEYWKNQYMDVKQAVELCTELNSAVFKYQRIGAWSVGAAWCLNKTDEEIDTISITQLYKEYLVYRTEKDQLALAYWMNKNEI